MKRYVFLLGYVFFLMGCIHDSGVEDYRYRLVVEGWIEEGNAACVILSQNSPLNTTIDSLSIENMVIRWAKVTVSDGEKTEVLSGKIDGSYFPPFIYYGTELLGETGKTYTLTVEYSGHVWTAQTVIPETVPLVALKAVPVEGSDTLYSIQATLQDPAGEKNYYKFFTRILHQKGRYWSSLMGNFDDNLFDGKEVEMTVNNGIRMGEIQKFTAYFHEQDTVEVKFCTMSEFDFDFWTAYENEQINSQNPLFPANQNLPSNVSSGRGCWCGYGKKTYVVWKP